jgi:hypothetical protein
MVAAAEEAVGGLRRAGRIGLRGSRVLMILAQMRSVMAVALVAVLGGDAWSALSAFYDFGRNTLILH